MIENKKCCWKNPSNNQQCQREIYWNWEYCLFHKPNKNQEENELFWKIIHNEWWIDNYNQNWIWIKLNMWWGFNFTWFIFPGFWDTIFNCKPRVTWIYNDFLYKFDYSIFSWNANFANYIFHWKTSFKDVIFNEWINFYNTTFNWNVYFENCKMYSWSWFMNKQFENTSFKWNEVIFRNFTKWSTWPDLFWTRFSDKTRIILEADYPKDFWLASYWEESYRIAKNQALKIWDYSLAWDYYYKERIYKRKQIIPDFSFRFYSNKDEKWNKNFIFLENMKYNLSIIKDYYKKFPENILDYSIYLLTWYWERPWNIIITSLLIILLWWIWYYVFWQTNWFLDSLYYSTITFTTLWAKTPEVLTWKLKLILWIESFIWWLFMALFVLTISKRYSRG